jgi:hypothetical protein
MMLDKRIISRILTKALSNEHFDDVRPIQLTSEGVPLQRMLQRKRGIHAQNAFFPAPFAAAAPHSHLNTASLPARPQASCMYSDSYRGRSAIVFFLRRKKNGRSQKKTP